MGGGGDGRTGAGVRDNYQSQTVTRKKRGVGKAQTLESDCLSSNPGSTTVRLWVLGNLLNISELLLLYL